MTNKQIDHMVNRFLSWKLPKEFRPDCGISFQPIVNEGTEFEAEHQPLGTNLFDSTQASEMVRCMLEGLPAAEPDLETESDRTEYGWVIEKYSGNKLHYWAGHNPDSALCWRDRHDMAIRFARSEDAMAVLMGLLKGDGRVAEHAWTVIKR